jgi:Ni/Co efflux regulator RcnB
MKRFATMALAAATALAPLVAPADASAQQWRHNDRHDNDRGRRDDHRGDRHDNDRWDRSRHNGYTYNGRWYYGPPPAAYYGRPGYSPGWHAWRRGEYLPGYYRNSYREVDWRHYRLRPPPRGYHWIRDDRGEFLLVGIATGLILGTLLGNY